MEANAALTSNSKWFNLNETMLINRTRSYKEGCQPTKERNKLSCRNDNEVDEPRSGRGRGQDGVARSLPVMTSTVSNRILLFSCPFGLEENVDEQNSYSTLSNDATQRCPRGSPRDSGLSFAN